MRIDTRAPRAATNGIVEMIYQVVIYHEIRDQDALSAYAKLAGPAIEKAGGRFIARGMPVKTLMINGVVTLNLSGSSAEATKGCSLAQEVSLLDISAPTTETVGSSRVIDAKTGENVRGKVCRRKPGRRQLV